MDDEERLLLTEFSLSKAGEIKKKGIPFLNIFRKHSEYLEFLREIKRNALTS